MRAGLLKSNAKFSRNGRPVSGSVAESREELRVKRVGALWTLLRYWYTSSQHPGVGGSEIRTRGGKGGRSRRHLIYM